MLNELLIFMDSITIDTFIDNPLRAAFGPYIDILGSMFFFVLMLGMIGIIYTAYDGEHKFMLLIGSITIIGITGIILLPTNGKVFLGLLFIMCLGWFFYLLFGTKQRNF